MRVAVAGEEALELDGIGRRAVTEEDEAGGSAFEDADATPDGGLHDEVGDVAFGAHEALELGAWNAEKIAVGKRAAIDERAPGAEEIELAGELIGFESRDHLAWFGFALGVDFDSAAKDDEEVDLALSASPKGSGCVGVLLAAVAPQARNHVGGEEREGHFRPEVGDRSGRVREVGVGAHRASMLSLAETMEAAALLCLS